LQRQMGPTNSWLGVLAQDVPAVGRVRRWVGVIVTLEEFAADGLGLEPLVQYLRGHQGTGLQALRVAQLSELAHFCHHRSCHEYFQKIELWWSQLDIHNPYGFRPFLENEELRPGPVAEERLRRLQAMLESSKTAAAEAERDDPVRLAPPRARINAL